jgi:YfiH family protein
VPELSSGSGRSEGFYFPTGNNGSVLSLRRAELTRGVIAFSTRLGGFSHSPFNSLNFSTRDGDRGGDVRRNIDIVGKALGIDAAGIVFSRQVHRANVQVVESVPQAPPTADALIAVKPGIYPAVKTADCLPILLLDPVRKISAAIHAGWKGTVLRITRQVIQILKNDLAVNPQDLIAAFGPAIGPCCYEVDERVLGPFREQFPMAESCISSLADMETSSSAGPPRHVELPGGKTVPATPLSPTRPANESFRLDLVRANMLELFSEGVPERNVHYSGLCTACYPDLFFSYRRQKGTTGRHIAVSGFKA